MEVFVSYSHRDEAEARRFKEQLERLGKSDKFLIFSDRQIWPGQDWDKEISQKLTSCDVFILLLSPDFLASDYCYGKEMSLFLDRHAKGESKVVPVILRNCDWERSPICWLENFPKDGRSLMSKEDLSESVRELISDLKKALDEVREKKRLAETPAATEAPLKPAT